MQYPIEPTAPVHRDHLTLLVAPLVADATLAVVEVG
jgi:hypothetical protein